MSGVYWLGNTTSLKIPSNILFCNCSSLSHLMIFSIFVFSCASLTYLKLCELVMCGLACCPVPYPAVFRAWIELRCNFHIGSFVSSVCMQISSRFIDQSTKYNFSPPIFQIHLCLMYSSSWAPEICTVENAWIHSAAMKILKAPSSTEALRKVGLILSLQSSFLFLTCFSWMFPRRWNSMKRFVEILHCLGASKRFITVPFIVVYWSFALCASISEWMQSIWWAGSNFCGSSPRNATCSTLGHDSVDTRLSDSFFSCFGEAAFTNLSRQRIEIHYPIIWII